MKIIINGIKQLQLKVHLTLLRLRLKLTNRSLYVKMRCSVRQYFLFSANMVQDWKGGSAFASLLCF